MIGDPVNNAILTGASQRHLFRDPLSGQLLHPDALAALRRLRQAARRAGFQVGVASAYRSFDRQCRIWNAKLAGRRPVLDDAGNTVAMETLDHWGQVQAVLRWSALPGASRHHWGTDLDIFDRGALGPHYPTPRLIPAESAPGGPFYNFHQWLQERLESGRAFGFYRPYAVDRGGVGPEPWHISYRPVALHYQRALTLARLRAAIERADLSKRDTVLHRLEEIHARFVCVPEE